MLLYRTCELYGDMLLYRTCELYGDILLYTDTGRKKAFL